MSNIRFIFGALALIFLFSGCSIKHDFHVQTPLNHLNKETYDYQILFIDMKSANNSQRTGTIHLNDKDFYASFTQGLYSAIDKTNLFDKNSNNRLVLNGTVLKHELPLFGLDMTTQTEVLYTVKNEKKEILYSNRIISSGKATVTERFIGFERGVLSHNRSIQNNIKMLCEDLVQNFRDIQKNAILTEDSAENEVVQENSWK